MKPVPLLQLSLSVLAAIPATLLASSLTLGPPVINTTDGTILFDVFATNDTWFSLQASGDLETWQHLGNHQVQLANRFGVSQAVTPGEARRFFRAQTPPPLRLAPATVALCPRVSPTA